MQDWRLAYERDRAIARGTIWTQVSNRNRLNKQAGFKIIWTGDTITWRKSAYFTKRKVNWYPEINTRVRVNVGTIWVVEPHQNSVTVFREPFWHKNNDAWTNWGTIKINLGRHLRSFGIKARGD